MSALTPFLHLLTLLWGAAVLVAAVVLARWFVAHERDLAPRATRRSARWAVGPGWVHEPRWWSVIVALAVARMLGDGVPLWLAAVVALGSGVVVALAGDRVLLVVVIPALVVEAVHVARGSAWLAGVGLAGWLVVPAVALAIWTAASPRSPARDRRRQPWWPETVATATFGVVELVLLPARLLLGLHAMAPPAWLWVPALALGAITCVRTARHGRAVVGIALTLVLYVAIQLAQVAGAYDGPLRTAVVLVTMVGGLLVAEAAVAPARRMA